VAQFPRCEPPSRLTLPSFTALSRADAEHELAPSRPVSFPLRACRSRGIAGNRLRTRQRQAENADGNEQTEKPLPTQVHTRRGSAARTALTYTPLATGGEQQMFGVSQQVPHAGAVYIKNGGGSAA
jgi:hypothetical protein